MRHRSFRRGGILVAALIAAHVHAQSTGTVQECPDGGPPVRIQASTPAGFAWEPVPGATHYNVYIDADRHDPPGYHGECLYWAIPDGQVLIAGSPGLSGSWLFQVTGLYADGEGTLGPEPGCPRRSVRRCTCTLPADPGPCDDDIPRWYHDYLAGDCREFSWGGCEGNPNNFESYDACAAACLDPCDLPAVVGDCDAAIPRFYFDKTSGYCEPFVYGGCGGNSNNFETAVECRDTCGGICALPVDPGPCDGTCPRWYFDTMTGRCEEFVWGCCGGNANNFASEQECLAACPPDDGSVVAP